MLNFSSPTLKVSISGLRGVFPDDLNAGNLPQLLEAFSRSLPPGDIAIARDNRPTGQAFLSIAAGVFASLGRNVYNLGLLPTPGIKAYTKINNLAGAVMLSASHNPVVYSGLKFIRAEGFFFDEKLNAQFLRNLSSQSQLWGNLESIGVIYDKTKEAVDLYIHSILDSTGMFHSGLCVAIDPVGSCAIGSAPALLQKLGARVVTIHGQETNYFPRPPEPTADALSDLSEAVRHNNCDIGFAFDPDADRLSIVDEKGNPLGEEYTLPLALLAALPERKGNVVVNLSTSHLNQFVAEKFGRTLYRSKVGEANVVDDMIAHSAAFGGEGNGGVIDPGINSFGRDALAGVAWILKLLARENKPLSEIVSKLPSLAMEKSKLALKDPLEIHHLYEKARDVFPDFAANTSDGLHLSAAGGLPWIHIRPSNTEPIVRIIAEGATPEETASLIDRLK